MNNNRFRRIFSKRLGMLVAVAENVASQGKQPGEGSNGGSGVGPLGVVSAMTAVALALLMTAAGAVRAQSLPSGGQVTAGQAAIAQSGNTMNINQGSQRTVIDWNRSVPTIATQKRSAMRKLRVENHVDLVKSATEMGLV